MSNCDFVKSQIHYVGHLLSKDGLSPLPEKVDPIRTMSPSKNIKELRKFLGLTGYYRNHINHYTDITNSLTRLLKMRPTYGQKFTNFFPELKKLPTITPNLNLQT